MNIHKVFRPPLTPPSQGGELTYLFPSSIKELPSPKFRRGAGGEVKNDKLFHDQIR